MDQILQLKDDQIVGKMKIICYQEDMLKYKDTERLKVKKKAQHKDTNQKKKKKKLMQLNQNQVKSNLRHAL